MDGCFRKKHFALSTGIVLCWLPVIRCDSAETFPPGGELHCVGERNGPWFELWEKASYSFALVGAGRLSEARLVAAHGLEKGLLNIRQALEECPIGIAAVYRALALATGLEQSAPSGRQALNIALRYQQLASAWLIYVFNNQANQDSSYIDTSAWPITSREFDEEHRTIGETLAAAGGATSVPKNGVSKAFRLKDVSIAFVTLCSYPPGTLLPRLATSVHRLYASRHGYAYKCFFEDTLSKGRPPAWGKIQALLKVLQENTFDWVVWVDCDIFFMDMSTTLDSILARYGSKEEDAGLDDRVQLLLNEDSQTVNTAFFMLRRSNWSLKFLEQVWGSVNSPWINHTWWEQAAFAHALLGANHRRWLDVTWEGLSSPWVPAYPPEVRVLPQSEVNSYHPISSRLVGDTWRPGLFILSFNGVQSLSGPNVAATLHANYYEVFCELNDVGAELCEPVDEDELAPWKNPGRNWLKSSADA